MEGAAACVAAAFGSQRVSHECASALHALLGPGASFLRASVRCGAGLFVSEDLLQPGHLELSVVSLRNSLAGVAMAQRQPVVVVAPAGPAGSPTARVICMPVAASVSASSSSGSEASCGSSSEAGDAASDQTAAATGTTAVQVEERPLYVGALLVGCNVPGDPPPELYEALQALALASAPYLLLLGLTKTSEMAQLLRLRAADCSCCAGGEEDELQDVPADACTPPMSPRGGAGGAGGGLAAAPKSSSAQAEEVEAEQEQLNAAAAVALAGESHLAAAASASSAAAEEAAGSSGAQQQHDGASEAVAALRQRPGYGQGPSKQPKHRQDSPAGTQEEEEDPKASLRRHTAVLAAAEAAAAATAARVPPPPSGPLLRFADPSLEAEFAAAHNRVLSQVDGLFAALHLSAILCLCLLRPPTLEDVGAAQAFALVLAVGLATLALNATGYRRHREALLVTLLLAHALLLRSCSLPTMLRLLPTSALERLPWLLRATGAESLALFPLGFKLRLHVFLPVQALCLALCMTALPGPCKAVMASSGCLPASLGRASGAVLLALGGLLPAAAVYHAEARARQRFLAARSFFAQTA